MIVDLSSKSNGFVVVFSDDYERRTYLIRHTFSDGKC